MGGWPLEDLVFEPGGSVVHCKRAGGKRRENLPTEPHYSRASGPHLARFLGAFPLALRGLRPAFDEPGAGRYPLPIESEGLKVPRLSPQEAAAKLVARAGQATSDYQAGVRRVNRAPGEMAAAAQDRMLASVTQAVQSGRWANRVRSVGLAEWQQRTADVGAARYAQGVQAAQDKIANRMQQLWPMIDAASAKARAMPATTKEQRIQRSVAFQTAMTKLGGR